VSNAHKGARLLLSGNQVVIDFASTYLDFNCDASGIEYGNLVLPIGNTVATIRSDGRFDGAIAVEQGTTNLINNGDLSQYSVNNSVGWDNSLNGTLVPSNSWASGYNSGVTSANVGYHAHINTERFGYPVWEFIDMNGQFGSNLRHRWLGASQYMTNNINSSFGWSGGSTVTISFDMMVDNVNKQIQSGIYHPDTGNSMGFGNTLKYHTCTQPFVWQRVNNTFTIDATWNITGSATLYLYGHYGINGYEGVAWVKNIQVETKKFGTSFANGTRANGYLHYDKGIFDPHEGTITFWYNTQANMPDQYPSLFSVGAWSSPAIYDWFALYRGSGWNNGNQLSLGIANGVTGETAGLSINYTFQPFTWYLISTRWSYSQNLLKVTIFPPNGAKVESSSTYNINVPIFSKYTDFQIGQAWNNGTNMINGIFSDFVIDKRYISDDELSARFLSNQPVFCPYDKRAYAL